MSSGTTMLAALLLLAGAAACDRTGEAGGAAGRTIPPADSAVNPLERPPIDDARVTLADVATTWKYRRQTAADLDGDAVPEQVILSSDVALDSVGAPLWEDGHRWALLVESSTGERTLLYGALVPSGHAEAAVLAAGSDGRRRVLVQERSPAQLRAFELEYRRPGSVRLSSAAYYQVEQWLPGPASE